MSIFKNALLNATTAFLSNIPYPLNSEIEIVNDLFTSRLLFDVNAGLGARWTNKAKGVRGEKEKESWLEKITPAAAFGKAEINAGIQLDNFTTKLSLIEVEAGLARYDVNKQVKEAITIAEQYQRICNLGLFKQANTNKKASSLFFVGTKATESSTDYQLEKGQWASATSDRRSDFKNVDGLVREKILSSFETLVPIWITDSINSTTPDTIPDKKSGFVVGLPMKFYYDKTKKGYSLDTQYLNKHFKVDSISDFKDGANASLDPTLDIPDSDGFYMGTKYIKDHFNNNGGHYSSAIFQPAKTPYGEITTAGSPTAIETAQRDAFQRFANWRNLGTSKFSNTIKNGVEQQLTGIKFNDIIKSSYIDSWSQTSISKLEDLESVLSDFTMKLGVNKLNGLMIDLTKNKYRNPAFTDTNAFYELHQLNAAGDKVEVISSSTDKAFLFPKQHDGKESQFAFQDNSGNPVKTSHEISKFNSYFGQNTGAGINVTKAQFSVNPSEANPITTIGGKVGISPNNLEVTVNHSNPSILGLLTHESSKFANTFYQSGGNLVTITTDIHGAKHFDLSFKANVNLPSFSSEELVDFGFKKRVSIYGKITNILNKISVEYNNLNLGGDRFVLGLSVKVPYFLHNQYRWEEEKAGFSRGWVSYDFAGENPETVKINPNVQTLRVYKETNITKVLDDEEVKTVKKELQTSIDQNLKSENNDSTEEELDTDSVNELKRECKKEFDRFNRNPSSITIYLGPNSSPYRAYISFSRNINKLCFWEDQSDSETSKDSSSGWKFEIGFFTTIFSSSPISSFREEIILTEE
jgi:hypothetical protein